MPIREAFARWASEDMAGAAAWLRNQRSQPFYDAAASNLAVLASLQDPAGAGAWAEAIQNPEIRAEALRITAQSQPR